jgi:tryptophan synthase alpha chain
MNRIENCFQRLHREKKKAVSLFVMAGYPTVEITIPLVVELAKSGADLIELGIPFSDPVADGPTIQHSSEIALRNGMTLRKTLSIAEGIRKETDIPLILMGYANPIMAFGMKQYLDSCKAIGVDGSIIADLPVEESREYRSLAATRKIFPIFLAAPTTTNERLVQLDIASGGFLYCISVTGVTGVRAGIAANAVEFLRRAKGNVKNNPILAGFGISTPEDAVALAKECDGIIIGSALMKILGNSNGKDTIKNASDFVRNIRLKLDSENNINVQ